MPEYRFFTKHPLLPRMDDYFDSLEEAQELVDLDTLGICWKVPIKDEDTERPVFSFHLGIYRYTQILFALRNVHAAFKRAGHFILLGIR